MALDITLATQPIGSLPYSSNAPQVSTDKMRRDFFNIWQKNVSIAIQQRPTDGDVGNYGNEDETNSFEINKEIRLNIQGKTTNAYTREKYGIDTTPSTWSCYALYTEDLQPTDRIIWNERRFIIQNLNKNVNNGGDNIFWSFDLKDIDKDTESFRDQT